MVAIDQRTLSKANDALQAFRMIEPTIPWSAGQAIAETLNRVNSVKRVDPAVMRSATKALDSSRFVDTTALSRTLTEINKAHGFRASETVKAMNDATALRVSGAMRAMNEANALRVSDMLKGVDLTASFRAGIEKTLRALDFPPAFRGQVAEALAQNTLHTAELRPRFEQAVGEAVVLADSPAASDRVDESFVGFEDLSPAELRELQKDVMNAIAALGTLVAILSRDGRVELASATLAFVAILISIYLAANRDSRRVRRRGPMARWS